MKIMCYAATEKHLSIMERTMDCKEFKSNIDSFIDGELDDQKIAEFEIHFTSCLNCHMEFESLKKCSNVLRGLLKAEVPPKSIQNNVFREVDKDK